MRPSILLIGTTLLLAATSAAQAPRSSMPDVARQHRERVNCHNAFDALVALQKSTGGNGASAEEVRWADSYDAAALAKQPCPAPPASVQARAANRTISNMESVNRLMKYYDAGDPAAIFELAQASFEQTVPHMTQQDGVELFKKAAALGDADANYMMARLYLGGQFGKKLDWDGARPFMQRAADAGHVDAMMMRALAAYDGTTERKDHKAAFAGFSAAAARGHVYATYMAAWMANNGEGTKKDHKLAYRLARNLHGQGEQAAGAVIAASALIYDNPRAHEDEVLYWMDEAIRTGDAKVSAQVGQLRPRVTAFYTKLKAPPAYTPRPWKACGTKTVCLVNSSGVRTSCTTNKDYWSDCDG
jgi:TPR repeat protein